MRTKFSNILTRITTGLLNHHNKPQQQQQQVLLYSTSNFPNSYSNFNNTNLTTNSNDTIDSSSDLGGGIRRYNYRQKRKKPKIPNLYEKISPLGDAITLRPELDDWVEQGRKISVAELIRIVRDFRKRSRYSQALEVSEWMNEKGLCQFTPTEHAVQLDLIGKVRGFQHAEDYFTNLPEVDKNYKTCGALLNCYVRQKQVDKALSHMRKMKEMGFASNCLTYNDIMCLYTSLGQYEKVPEVLDEMKEVNVLPDNYSYRLCINAYGVRSDIEAMENILKDMETKTHMAVDWNTYAVAANFYIKAGLTDKAVGSMKKAEVRLNCKDGTGYNHLISLNSKLEKKDEILRLWNLEKSTCQCVNRDYINVLESLIKLGELEAAENIVKDWESSGNCYDFRVPNRVIMAYVEKEMFEKAVEMLEELSKSEKSSSPRTWSLIALRYLERDEFEKSFHCMKAGLSFYVENKGWTPSTHVIVSLLRWIGDHGSIEDVESFVDSLKKVMQLNRQMYHALLKAYIRAGKNVDGLLEKMKVDEITKDKETKEILDKIQSES